MRMRLSMLIVLLASALSSAHGQRVRIQVLGKLHPGAVTIAGSGRETLWVFGCGESHELQPGIPLAVRFRRGQEAYTLRGKTRDCSRLRIASRTGDETEFVIGVPGRLHRRYRGIAEVNAVNGELSLVVSMDVETAVASIVAAEMSDRGGMEALKAQAVAARSFLMASSRTHKTFDFCDSTHCQFLRQPPAERSMAARATRRPGE